MSPWADGLKKACSICMLMSCLWAHNQISSLRTCHGMGDRQPEDRAILDLSEPEGAKRCLPCQKPHQVQLLKKVAFRFNDWQRFLSQWPGERRKDATQGGLVIFPDAEREAIIAGIHEKSALFILLQPNAFIANLINPGVQLQDGMQDMLQVPLSGRLGLWRHLSIGLVHRNLVCMHDLILQSAPNADQSATASTPMPSQAQTLQEVMDVEHTAPFELQALNCQAFRSRIMTLTPERRNRMYHSCITGTRLLIGMHGLQGACHQTIQITERPQQRVMCILTGAALAGCSLQIWGRCVLLWHPGLIACSPASQNRKVLVHQSSEC